MSERKKGIGPACPHCGHIRSTRLSNGWSEPDDHYLRYKKCEGCGAKFATVEVAIPDRTSFYRLDYRGREYRRDYWRRHYAKTNLRLTTQNSDQLQVKVRIYRSKAAHQCIRGHAFTPDNTYLNPSSKFRRCKQCRDITARRYYQRNRDAILAAQRVKRAA